MAACPSLYLSYLVWHIRILWLVFHKCIRLSRSASQKWDPYLCSYYRFPEPVSYPHPPHGLPIRGATYWKAIISLWDGSPCNVNISPSSLWREQCFLCSLTVSFMFHEAGLYLLCSMGNPFYDVVASWNSPTPSTSWFPLRGDCFLALPLSWPSPLSPLVGYRKSF